jgi:hypothetical protein
MISKRRLSVLFISLLIFTACASKTAPDQAWQFYKEGRYPEAIEQADQAIQDPQNDQELYHSYFIRAESNMAAGFPDRAYHDYYAAKIVSCYIVRQAKPARGYAVGMIPSSYCNKWSDQKMAAAASEMPRDRTAELKQEAEKSLARYLE